MKRLTTNTITLGFFLAVTVISACRTKDLATGKNQNEKSQRSALTMQSSENELYFGKRSVLIKDSTNQFLKVKIFPLDTFNFSLANGFTGRAARIELTGVAQRTTSTLDNSEGTAARRSKLDYEQKANTRAFESSNAKILKKKTLGIPFWMWIGLGAITVFLLLRFWRNLSMAQIFHRKG